MRLLREVPSTPIEEGRIPFGAVAGLAQNKRGNGQDIMTKQIISLNACGSNQSYLISRDGFGAQINFAAIPQLGLARYLWKSILKMRIISWKGRGFVRELSLLGEPTTKRRFPLIPFIS